MVDVAQSVVVVFKLLTFNLIVSFLSLCNFRLHRARDHVDVAVHATDNSTIELPRCDLMNLSGALCCVEVTCGKRKNDPVDWNKLHARALLLLVKPDLEVL